ncbi:unnamed protein product [Arctia plantaginis]|uniref:Proton-coupled folate transporter n=1 Tax=Arctia plantaginis TaxID=874455 RepID=A0A8S0ZQD2_ARCPL|nr:unnamed protein product [Arctia plantaginis]
MAQDEERLTENNPTVNTVPISNELPAKPFRITIELPLFLVMAGIALSGVAVSNITLNRSCVHALGYTKEECAVFLSLEKNNETDLEKEVQKYVTTLSTVRSVIEGVVPAVLSLFLGVWSDTHGRKPLLVWPLLGLAMSSILMVIVCTMDNLGPWWIVATCVPLSLSGGFTVMFTGAFCFLNDITSTESRSLRMTFLEASLSMGSIVGSLLSAPILSLVGNTWLILIAATCNVLAYAFCNVFVKESLTGALQGGITTIFDGLLVKEMVHECFKRRPNNGRAQILLLTLANSLSIFILYGTLPLDYLYTREKLNWTLYDFKMFDAISTTISFVGAFVGIGLLQKLIGFGDLFTSNIAYISTLADSTIRAFAISSWHMYLGAGVSLFRGLSGPLIRSFLSKILPVVDVAKVFTLMSAIEGLCPIVAPILYNSLYRFTISTFPGAIYLLSSGVIAICVVCLSFVQYFRWNTTSQYQLLESSLRS